MLVYFGAQKTHLGFYPTAALITAYAEALRSYQTSKGAIQFPYDRPLPVELIAELARYRLTHQTTRTSAKRRPPVAVPEAIAEALAPADLTQAYAARPQYQRTDYLNWIARAKQPATKQRRLTQMLAELKAGDVYMRQSWRPRARHDARE